MSTTIATAPAVFITVPKYVAITPSMSAGLAKIRPAPAPTTTQYIGAPAASPTSTCGYASSTSDDGVGGVPKGKKRRLDHLSWEEKVQRKKLKNRVAAQTSRDRKKARMEEMEHEVNELNERADMLQNKCDSLQVINESLMAKNQKLDMELETLRQQLTELQQQQQSTNNNNNNANNSSTVATCAGCESILNGSAVSTYTDDPLQQGSTNMMDSQSTQAQQLRKTSTMATLWRIVALCLLYKTCSPSTKSSTTSNSSMRHDSKSSPRACSPISQQTWRQAIERAMQLLPKMQAAQSGCLDQWWGPQQSAWNPANIANATTVSA